MIKKISFSLFILFGFNTIAQNHTDALRYSQEFLWGSARFTAMGGAFGSLGANANCASYNPAGTSIYTTNELSTSISFYENENQFNINGLDSYNKNSEVFIPNFNYVSANIFNPSDVGDWNRLNFGIGYNKLDDYNRTITINNPQTQQSYTSLILENSENILFEDLNPFRELLAFNTYLIDTLGSAMNYQSPANGIESRDQAYRSLQSGGKNEFYVNLSTSYQDKLFIGATIGFPSFEYNEITTITENNFNSVDQSITDIESFDYTSRLFASGSGINLKLGLIYKIDNSIRYGLSLHTPTYYDINEEYSTEINTVFDNGDRYHSSSPQGFFDYGLNTPFKLTNSFSFIFNKRALLSVDCEYLNYATSNINSDFYSFSQENYNIETLYGSTLNFRLGSEIRIHPQFSLRAGYAYYGNPMIYLNEDLSREYLTLGWGIKHNQYFLDMAMINAVSPQSSFIRYNGGDSATVSNSNSQLIISTGLKF